MNRSKYLKSAKENRPLPVKITPNPQRNRLIYKTIATNTDDEEIHLSKTPSNKTNPLAKNETLPTSEAKTPKTCYKKMRKAYTPRVRLKFYLPSIQFFPPRRTLCSLLSFL